MIDCPHCGKEACGKAEDVGIGPYEFWGAIHNDSQMIITCEHCGEELDEPYWEWQADQEADEGDYLYNCMKDKELDDNADL